MSIGGAWPPLAPALHTSILTRLHISDTWQYIKTYNIKNISKLATKLITK